MVVSMRPPAITDEDWARFEPPSGYRAEVIRGEVVLSPSPTRLHVNLQNRLMVLMASFVPDGFEAIFGAEWKLPEKGWVAQAPQPDLMVVRVSDEPVVEPPILAFEILSTSDHRRLEHHPRLTRIQGKRLDYAEHGLLHYVEIDPFSPVTVTRFEMAVDLTPVETATDVLVAETPFLYSFNVTDLVART